MIPSTTRHLALMLCVLSILILSGCAGLNTAPEPPKQIQAHMDVASSFLREGKPRRSLQELLKIKDRADAYPDYHFLAGITYMELQDSNKAIHHFQRAVQQKPEFGEAWNNLGQVYASNQQRDKAVQAFERALEIQTYLTPEYPAYNLARLYQRQKDYSEAIAKAQQALKLNWRYLPAYYLIADLYLERDQIEQATEWLKKGVDAFPDNAQLMLRLAENQLRLGRNADALYWLERIQKKYPDSEAASMAQDYLDILEE
jgi:tetratricopeptide (TPR) repeat protein